MCKRVLSFLLAASAAFCFICSSAPEAQAIVPIGFVQSALASYVSSTGYKLYNDNGTGQDILGSLGELYDDYVTIADKTITGQLANLAFLANSPYIYQDNSGQIVVSKVAADIFQDFADWIQTEYSVPVGSDTPTNVVQASGGFYTDGNGYYMARFSVDESVSYYTQTSGGVSYSAFVGPQVGYYTGSWGGSIRNWPLYIGASSSSFIFCSYGALNPSLTSFYVGSSVSSNTVYLFVFTNNRYVMIQSIARVGNSVTNTSLFTSDYSIASVVPSSVPSYVVDINSLSSDGSGVAALGVTLAQAVADVVGQANEDDAVVIGVGASAGATAQDIADMVAQGVKAQTLDPSVSITAEAVIDTPVQPYPDIDGLGLPTLGAALVDRFPFCIPWDFVDTVKLLSADPQPINIKVDLIPQRIKTSVGITSDTSFDIDLSGEQYAKIGVFCRWGSLITFCFGLFLLTKRLVWTA